MLSPRCTGHPARSAGHAHQRGRPVVDLHGDQREQPQHHVGGHVALHPVHGVVDGALGSLRLWDSKVRLVGFWGILAPVGMKAELREDASDNSLLGGQLVVSPLPEAEVSVAYAHKTMKAPSYLTTRPDSLFNPYPVEINPSAEKEQILSGELRVDSPRMLSGYFRYDYDIDLEKTSRFHIFARGRIVDELWVTGEYLQREPRIAFNNTPSYSYSGVASRVCALVRLARLWQVRSRFVRRGRPVAGYRRRFVEILQCQHIAQHRGRRQDQRPVAHSGLSPVEPDGDADAGCELRELQAQPV